MKLLKRSLFIALWFVFLTFPLLVVKVNTTRGTVDWRWINMLWVGLGAFALYPLWRYLLARRAGRAEPLGETILAHPWLFMPLAGILSLTGLIVPLGILKMLLKEIHAQRRVVIESRAPAPSSRAAFLAKLLLPAAIAGASLAVSLAMGDWARRFVLLTTFGLLAAYLALPAALKALRGSRQPLHNRAPIFQDPKTALPAMLSVLAFAVVFPFLFSLYQIKIMLLALTYIILGLGLNIVVGLAGLLDLGYVAFYGVGAYTYGLLYYYFQVPFWMAFPLGGIIAAIFGVLLGFPVLRLRGDYLAIVTLGFGEIFRLVMENWGSFSQGPSGIKNIPPPLTIDRGGLVDHAFSSLGITFNMQQVSIVIYFIMLILVVLTIFAVNRLQDSRIGRAWLALREDEIACQAMGIDKTRTKLTAFALGATWAGFAGVLFAARERFISPKSFEFIESAMILSVVVLGGMGSIVGVIMGALILMLVPEYLRVFSDYRMLLFGAVMVLIMVFRPQGLVSNVRRSHQYKGDGSEALP